MHGEDPVPPVSSPPVVVPPSVVSSPVVVPPAVEDDPLSPPLVPSSVLEATVSAVSSAEELSSVPLKESIPNDASVPLDVHAKALPNANITAPHAYGYLRIRLVIITPPGDRTIRNLSD
jgi:hypothetical protein